MDTQTENASKVSGSAFVDGLSPSSTTGNMPTRVTQAQATIQVDVPTQSIEQLLTSLTSSSKPEERDEGSSSRSFRSEPPAAVNTFTKKIPAYVSPRSSPSASKLPAIMRASDAIGF
jgi:hypothetical protein